VNPSRAHAEARRRGGLACLAFALAGCAPRVEVVDAVSGLPVAAQVRALDSGQILVEASGYDMWSGPPQAQVALHPLWIRRFADEQVAPRRTPAPPCAGCPGTRSR
jgi:hypothetical protein